MTQKVSDTDKENGACENALNEVPEWLSFCLKGNGRYILNRVEKYRTVKLFNYDTKISLLHDLFCFRISSLFIEINKML